MENNSYWRMLRLSWFRKKPQPEISPVGEPAIFVKKITFSDGTLLDLQPNSIVILTGPNNAGKSSVLRAIDSYTTEISSSMRPVVSNIEIATRGTAAQFREFVEARSLKASTPGTVLIGRSDYKLDRIEDDIKKAFRGSGVSGLFCSRLGAGERLSLVAPERRDDWRRTSPTTPVQWLDVDTEAENEVSAAFRNAFGMSLVVNRVAGERLLLHVSSSDQPDFQTFRDYMSWVSSLPPLDRQGDGMKSFAAALLTLKVHPKSLVLLDEPEAFLHYPQARKLAEVITKDTAPNTQIWLATHNDEIVRGILDHSNDRIIFVRLDRIGNKTIAKPLKSDQVKTLWADPLLRTSDVLSALFHEVAIICEGESDARFFRALIDTNITSERLPDLRFYHVGGKDKIVSIVSALRLLDLPVCVIADIDILSDMDKFLGLFESLGGNRQFVQTDVKLILQHIMQRKALISGRDAAIQLRKIAEDVEAEPQISSANRTAIARLVQEASPWERVKEDGYRGLGNATIIQAFDRVYEQCKRAGLIINKEGELEGLCRDILKRPKSNWLNEVLSRDLAHDPSLEDARKMLSELRHSINFVRSSLA